MHTYLYIYILPFVLKYICTYEMIWGTDALYGIPNGYDVMLLTVY